MEFQLASMDASVEVTRSGLDEKSDNLRDVEANHHLTTTATAITATTAIIIATSATPPRPPPFHPFLSSSRSTTTSLVHVQVKLKEQERKGERLQAQTLSVIQMEREVKQVIGRSSAWGLPFWILFLLLVALAGVGYNRYRKIMKSHLL